MSEYTIILDGELENMLKTQSRERGISPDQFISDIINRYLPLMHNIDREEMAKGYAEMAEINSEISNKG